MILTPPVMEEKTMISKTRNLLTAALLALVAVSTPALSQHTGWYVGLGVGQSTFKGSCDGVVGPGISCAEKDTAFKILEGYQVNQNFGVEFAYIGLGETTASFAGFGSAAIAAKGVELLIVGTSPIDQQWSVYGKLGFFRWAVDFKDGTGLLGSASATGTDLTYGIGVKYNFTKNAASRMEYQQYNDVGDFNTTGKGDISVMGVGVIIGF